MSRSSALGLALSIVTVVLAGCVAEDLEPSAVEEVPVVDEVVGDVVAVATGANRTFVESVVDTAVSFMSDLYEPTMEVSDTGVIYITGHTILVDTTGAPVFRSADGGKTWEQLPFLASQTMPEPVHGATPPPSDEIFLVAGDDGWLYGADITGATFPLNAWRGDGTEHAYHNPNAYDRVGDARNAPGAFDGCGRSLNDRPWAAYANGTLLLVNNAGTGAVQVGVLDVPPADPVGVGGTPLGAEWNLCAATGSFIPGIPDVRDDGLFAVPFLRDGELMVLMGNVADIHDVREVAVTKTSSAGGMVVNFGQVAADAEGNFFAAVQNNTRVQVCEDVNPPFDLFVSGCGYEATSGQFQLAASGDDGETWNTRTFATDGIVTSVYMDGNMMGRGALVVWATFDRDNETHDWFVGHAFIGDDGAPVLENVSKAIADGPRPSSHVTGAAVGPDGRAYLATYVNGGLGSTPLSVWIQQDGPVLPGAVVDGNATAGTT